MTLAIAILGTEILRIQIWRPKAEPELPSKGDCISVGFTAQIGAHE
jgi:hypothetical protein